jgi:PAS domain S-box-containing protein/putative nucleotidyltransferase with HDIG domain
MKILIAEDEPIIALDIRKTLDKLGYQVIDTVDTGDLAISAAGTLFPDLILMDIKLRGETTGIDAAGSIRDKLGIPVIYLTAHADTDTLQRAKLTEPYGYLIKPVTESELYTTIETAVHRSRLEQKVRESEKRYRTLVETISHGIVEFDAEGTVLFCNNALTKMTGYSADDLTGASIWKIIHPGIPGATGSITDSLAYSGGSPSTFTDSVTTSDGRVINVQVDWNSKPRGRNGPPGFIAVITDFTEKLDTEDRLSQSFHKIRRTLGATVNALATTIERRDPYTAGHQQRVALLACAIARELGMPPDRVEGINIAALVHDIGKIHIPSEILSKPSRLSAIEFEMIKTHSQVGYDILKDIEFDWPIPDMVLQHHEKLDGSGYPGGLSGDEIVYEAKIISVADIVEAMASHRPYRPGLGIEIALGEISKNRGKFYDSDVADACARVFEGDSFRFDVIPGNQFT